jgi:hypothetical protein
MATKIQLRRDTASDWTSTNPTLAAGEFGWESDTNKFKIGDGATAWTSLAYASDGDTAGITFVGDDSTGTLVSQNETFKIAGTQNVTTAVSGDTLTVTGPDLSSYATGSSTTTFTNKTFDANGTGNSISNIETADIAAGTLVTAAEGIASNNNDTTIPTSAAVKAYADSVGGGGSATGLTFVGDDSTGTLISDGETVKIAGGTGITTAMSGDTLTITASGGGGGTITALNNQAENRLVSIGSTTTELDGEANLTFDGSTLTLTGSAALDGVTIADNHITTNRSNDDLHISANGTGKVNISNSDAVPEDNLVYSNGFGTIDRNRGVRIWESVSAQGDMTTGNDRDYGHLLAKEWRLTSGLTSSDSDNRYRAFNAVAALDLNGAAMTGTSGYSGPQGGNGFVYLDNSNASAATMSHSTGMSGGIYAYPTVGAITATNTYGIKADIDFDGSSASMSGTNGYLFHAAMYSDGGTTSLTNGYGVYISDLSLATNKYAFYDATNSLSVFGDIQTQAVSITDNVISTNRSNDDLIINSSGTGRITISTDGTRIEDSATYLKYQGNPAFVKGVVLSHELTTNPDTLTSREYGHSIHLGNTLTASSSTNSNFRPRSCIFSSQTDMAGYDYTVATLSRGPVGLFAAGSVNNSSATTASTLATVKAASITTGCADYDSPTQDLTITNAIAVQGAIDVDHNGEGDVTITNGYNFYANHGAYADSTGAATITNNYGFYYTGSDATNRYAFWDSANVLSRFGAVILANQAGDPSGVTDSAHIYAKDDAGSSEVYVRDEAGNVTKISPHNDAGEWEYYSVNKNTGKKVRVNMERMIKRLEEITGETFIENE